VSRAALDLSILLTIPSAARLTGVASSVGNAGGRLAGREEQERSMNATLAELLIGVIGVMLLLAVVSVGVLLYHRHRSAAREHRLHEDLHEQRQDIERREHRISEREDRLDSEQRHLDERTHQLADAEAALEARK
jgi:hypothetical protein